MRTVTAFVIAIAAVAAIVAAGAGAYVIMDSNDNNAVTHDITYVLNDGKNSPDNPDKYTEGKGVTFSDATREGYLFLGWYTDAEFTEQITSISKECKENVTVYAKWRAAETYSITYNLNEGTNSESNPSTYTEGTSVTLSDPTREGYIFLGWYTDAEFTNEIEKISGTSNSDITLYAQWEKSSIGLVLNFDFDGTMKYKSWFYTNTVTIDGTKSYSYLYYDRDKGYLMSYTESYTKTSGGKTTSYSDSDTYWSEETSDCTWTVEENTETISTFEGMVECEVWVGTTSSSTETQYIGVESGLPYKIVYKSSNSNPTTTLTYTLTGTDQVTPADSYEVKAYADKGITVTGSGTNAAYTSVTLTATAESGTTFKGWYNEYGTLVSSSRTYTIDPLLTDTTVYALNNNDEDLTFDSTSVTIEPAKPLTDVTWTIVDGDSTVTRTGDTLVYEFTEVGTHSISYSGKDSSDSMYYGYCDVFVDGYVTKSYSWKYNNVTYNTDLDIKYSAFLYYRNYDDINRYDSGSTNNLKFVTYTDQYIVTLSGKLMNTATTAGWDDLQKADFILAFTQYIEYQYDSDSMGQEEYWKFPVETLFDQNGDCEDTSILFCAIAKASGLDCCMLLFTGHMAAGVAVDCDSEYTYVSGSTTYYYCETTGVGYSVGDIPKDSNGNDLTVYAQNGRYYQSITPIV